MAAAGGGNGGGATASSCGLKSRYAPGNHEEKDMMNQDQASTEDQCGRFWNGMDLLGDVNENKRFVPTGLEGIDMLLGGGLRQGQLTEITGPSSSGKTQVAAKNMGAVMYLDTSNSSLGRIANIIDGTSDLFGQKGCEAQECHEKHHLDIFALLEVLRQLELSLMNDKVKCGGSKICLLVIDSISSLLAPIIGGKYPQGRSMMISVATILKKL